MRALNSVECPADRLVCFPYSGGTAAAYRAWSPAMPEDTELLAVQYPGQADRIVEAPASSITEMASAVAAELSQLGPARCALFGHSLGALVAYETAKVLRDLGQPVHCLFVSGTPAPWQAHGELNHRVGDEELWSALRDLGGIAPDVADDPELRELLLPVLRSYIALSETYRPAPHTEPLTCQVRGYYNTEDPLVNGAEFGAWAAVSTGRFSVRTWPGGHFQSLADPDELIADVVSTLAESEVLR
ncbi:thioesterase II family protein [Microbispora sp. CA-135349]|uniref:thioesterase II family protein n=1 Tax=Microbispora sp. CA-135349 TaxID=3239953 RepID=UPI003D936DE4